jgi:hypothetical protein
MIVSGAEPGKLCLRPCHRNPAKTPNPLTSTPASPTPPGCMTTTSAAAPLIHRFYLVYGRWSRFLPCLTWGFPFFWNGVCGGLCGRSGVLELGRVAVVRGCVALAGRGDCPGAGRRGVKGAGASLRDGAARHPVTRAGRYSPGPLFACPSKGAVWPVAGVCGGGGRPGSVKGGVSLDGFRAVSGDNGGPGAGCPVFWADRPLTGANAFCLWVLTTPCPVASTRGALLAPVSETQVPRMGK